MFLLAPVISEPDNVTVCEGGTAVFSCVLQWYRFIKSTSTIEPVDQHGESINFITHTTGNAINSTLIIINANTSHNGYYWVGTPSSGACNASLTVATSM